MRDTVAGRFWPLLLSLLYVVALGLGWGTTGGGFSSLAAVRQLFSGDWTLLAGWVHYLAFDLFVGAWIAAETERAGLSTLVLIPVLPLTFLFGPAGFLLFLILRQVLCGGSGQGARHEPRRLAARAPACAPQACSSGGDASRRWPPLPC